MTKKYNRINNIEYQTTMSAPKKATQIQAKKIESGQIDMRMILRQNAEKTQ